MAKNEMVGKIPPQNTEAEAAVLGAILTNKEAMDKISKNVKVKTLDDEIDAIALCITHLATHKGI